MAASLEGETQQPAFRVDSLSVPQPAHLPSSSQPSADLDYADLDRSLSHRTFLPPPSSPPPESADPNYAFLPAQVIHAESAQTGDLHGQSVGESTAAKGQLVVEGGDLLRVGLANGQDDATKSKRAGPPVRRTGSGRVIPTWATQRQKGSSGEASAEAERQGEPSRPSSRALDRIMRAEEEDQLDSSSPAPSRTAGAKAEKEAEEEMDDSPPDVPTPPSATPHSHRPVSRPITPVKANGTYKPVSAHKPPSLRATAATVNAIAGPSRVQPAGSRPNRSPTRPASSRLSSRRTAPARDDYEETQESLFGMDDGIKGRQKLDQLARMPPKKAFSRSISAPRSKRGTTPATPKILEKQALVEEAREAETEKDERDSTAGDRDTGQPTTRLFPGSLPTQSPTKVNGMKNPEQSLASQSPDGPLPPLIRRATARKVIPDSSDNEQEGEGEGDHSILFTQATHRSGDGTTSGLDIKTPSQKEALAGRNILDDISVGEIPREMQIMSDTYIDSQDHPDVNGNNDAEEPSHDATSQPLGDQLSSLPEPQPSSPLAAPKRTRGRFRFNDAEGTMTSVPPALKKANQRRTLQLSQASQSAVPASFDADPDRKELFSSPSGAEYTQQTSISGFDQGFQATQYVAQDPSRAAASGFSQDGPASSHGNEPSTGPPDHQFHSMSQISNVNGAIGAAAENRNTQSQHSGSNGTAESAGQSGSNQSHSQAQEMTQTQIASEDSQRRAEEAAKARQKEREESMERRNAAVVAMTATAAGGGKEGNAGAREPDAVEGTLVDGPLPTDHPAEDPLARLGASPTKHTAASAPARKSDNTAHVPAVKAHRLLRRTTSRHMVSAPLPAAAIDIGKSSKPSGLTESFSESNIGQGETLSLSGPAAKLLDESNDSSHDNDQEHGYSLHGSNGEQAGRIEVTVEKHRRQRSMSSNVNEPTSSMQAEELMPLGVITQRTASASPEKDDNHSQTSEPSLPIKRAGVRRMANMRTIKEIPSSSPVRRSSPAPAAGSKESSPLRSEPPSPPRLHDQGGEDVDMDALADDGNRDPLSDVDDNPPQQDTLLSVRDSSVPSSNLGRRSAAQTLEPTLVDGTVPSLVVRPKMPEPSRKYGTGRRGIDPASPPDPAPAAPHVKPNRLLTRAVRRRRSSTDPLARPSETLAALDKSAQKKSRQAGDEDQAGPDAEEDAGDDDSERPRAGKRGRRSAVGRSKRVLRSPSSDMQGGDVDIEAANNNGDVNQEHEADEEHDDVERRRSQQDEEDQGDRESEGAQDDTGDGDELEEETPDSPATPEDTTDYSFRPPAPKVDRKGKGKAKALPPAPAAASRNKRKRVASPTASASGGSDANIVTTKRARHKPRRFTPNNDSPARSTRKSAATSRAHTTDPQDGEDDSDPESPETPIDTSDYTFHLPAPRAKAKTLIKQASDLTSVASASSSRKSKADANAKAGSSTAKRTTAKGRATRTATPLQTRSQSVTASRATAEPTPAASDDDDDGDSGDDDDNVDIDGPGIFCHFGEFWFAGRVIQRLDEQQYKVEFADTTYDYKVEHQMRKGELRQGDKIRSNAPGDSKKIVWLVKDNWSYPTTFDEAERDTPIHVTNAKTGEDHAIPLRNIYMHGNSISHGWDDRRMDPAALAELPFAQGGVGTAKATRSTAVSKTVSRVITAGSNVFAGRVFLISAAGTKAETTEFTNLIVGNGGEVCEWEALFASSNSPSGGGPSTPQITFGAGLKTRKTPYLISGSSLSAEFEGSKKGEKMKAKVMCALAFGIPCLSIKYIKEALRDPGHDIRGFLLVPGTSLKHGALTSQIIDTAWGAEQWDVRQARHELKPLKGRKILFAGQKPNETLVPIVTACLTGLGAASLKIINGFTGEDVNAYDAVLVANKFGKTPALPPKIQSCGRGCDVQWLKQICASLSFPDSLPRLYLI